MPPSRLSGRLSGRLLSSPSASTCACVDCDDVATGQYLDLRQGVATEFAVCAAHFARIEGGERPAIVPQAGENRFAAAPALFLA